MPRALASSVKMPPFVARLAEKRVDQRDSTYRYPRAAVEFVSARIRGAPSSSGGGDLRAKILRLFGAALLCGVGVASCTSVDSLGVATLDEQKALISDAASTSPNLQPGEKIKVTVFGEDRLSGEYEIDPGGNISASRSQVRSRRQGSASTNSNWR